jgi:hypothetical protein
MEHNGVCKTSSPRRDYHSTMNAVIPVRAVKRSEFIVDEAFDLTDMGEQEGAVASEQPLAGEVGRVRR